MNEIEHDPYATLPPGDDPDDAYDIDVARYWRDIIRRNRRRIGTVILALALLAVVVLLSGCKSSAQVRAACEKRGGHIEWVDELVPVYTDPNGNPGLTYRHEFVQKCVGARR